MGSSPANLHRHGKTILLLIAIFTSVAWTAMGVTFFHAADTTKDWEIDLSELLRVIQFYNSDGFHVAGGTEDGYAPGPGDISGSPHDSDYAPLDWRIEMPELLRVIQFFNVRGIVYAPAAEDHYDVNLWHAPVEGDTDGDGLRDNEELALGMDPDNADENGDGLPDGGTLATSCAETWLGLAGCPLYVCGYYGPLTSEEGEESLLEVTECSLCVASTEESACEWVHPDTQEEVSEFWWILYDSCQLRDSYIASEGDPAAFCDSIVSFRWMESAAMPFLRHGSFSYYDLSCSSGAVWSWDTAAARRVDAVYYIQLLLGATARR